MSDASGFPLPRQQRQFADGPLRSRIECLGNKMMRPIIGKGKCGGPRNNLSRWERR